MRILSPLLALFATALTSSAYMGDSLLQSIVRYGQPVASSKSQPGQVTSTKTFAISGLTIICGYINGKVVMETVTNPSRDFLPAEVEALLRTEGRHVAWTPAGPYAGNMSYKRADGVTGKLTGNQLEIVSPAWTAALAKDEAAANAKSTGLTNAAPLSPASGTSATSSTSDDALNPPARHVGTVTTNAAP